MVAATEASRTGLIALRSAFGGLLPGGVPRPLTGSASQRWVDLSDGHKRVLALIDACLSLSGKHRTVRPQVSIVALPPEASLDVGRADAEGN